MLAPFRERAFVAEGMMSSSGRGGTDVNPFVLTGATGPAMVAGGIAMPWRMIGMHNQISLLFDIVWAGSSAFIFAIIQISSLNEIFGPTEPFPCVLPSNMSKITV